jgi:hypothetical protein
MNGMSMLVAQSICESIVIEEPQPRVFPGGRGNRTAKIDGRANTIGKPAAIQQFVRIGKIASPALDGSAGLEWGSHPHPLCGESSLARVGK